MSLASSLRRFQQAVSPRTRESSDLATSCALIVASATLFVVSESAWYGDATSYAADIRAGKLIEPGHLLWRPLGGLFDLVLGPQAYSAVLWQLQFLCLSASILAVIAMYRLASRLYGRPAALAAASLLVVSNGFWIYSFSGCAYSLSVLFTILALRQAIAVSGAPVRGASAFAAGLFAGLAVATWGLQILAAPAIWLALMLTPAREQSSRRLQLTQTARLAAGYLLAFIVPVVTAYLLQIRGYGGAVAVPSGRPLSLAAWLASSGHGIGAHYSASQLLRVLMGWPQSIISTSDLGWHLRLWRLQEGSFPASAWLGVFVVFYAALVGAILVLRRGYSRLDRRDRAVILASCCALLLNLLFAASWQGTDPERYFPSLPFQLLLVALVVRLLTTHHSPRRVAIVAAAALSALAVVNWYGTLAVVLPADSYRQVWLRELRHSTEVGDLVILFGQRNQGILSPHDPTLPKIDNVSLEIQMRGEGWRAAELHDIAETRHRGGRVFLADTLFGSDDGPRDGWSFREYPRPTPSELEEAFVPFKSDRIGFVVGSEKVWLGKE